MAYGIIYKITNLINNKIYIGQTTTSLKRRWQGHLFTAKHEKRAKNIYFYNAIRKYGEDAFKMEQIDSCNSQEELNDKERYWIAYFKSNIKNFGYNSTSGGNSKGKLNQEIKDKISKANKGNKNCLGRILSKETRNKISKSLKNSKKLKNFHKSKEVLLYCFETQETMTFKEFCKKYPNKNFSREAITCCCHGKYATANGWHWCLAKDKDTYISKEIINKKHPVYCIETQEIFESIAQAKKAYPQCSSLEKVCMGIKHKTGNLHWCYLENKDTYKFPESKDKKKVYCVETNMIYESAADAAKQLNLIRHSITSICRKNKEKRQLYYTIHNYHFFFIEDKDLFDIKLD